MRQIIKATTSVLAVAKAVGGSQKEARGRARADLLRGV